MFKKNKRGISELVSYVLLIILAVGIASGVFVWLKYLAVKPQYVECPDIGFIIEEDTCFGANQDFGNITFYLKNNGNFDITGFKMMVANSDKKIFRNISLKSDCPPIALGQFEDNLYGCPVNVSETAQIFGKFCLDTIKYIRISAIKEVEGKLAYCKPIDFPITNCIQGTGC
jgi:hypothetical protein